MSGLCWGLASLPCVFRVCGVVMYESVRDCVCAFPSLGLLSCTRAAMGLRVHCVNASLWDPMQRSGLTHGLTLTLSSLARYTVKVLSGAPSWPSSPKPHAYWEREESGEGVCGMCARVYGVRGAHVVC